MGTKSLAETIILQSIEDLFNPQYKKESINFFRGEGFDISAEMAGMGISEKRNLLNMFGILPGENQERSDTRKKIFAGGRAG